MCKKPLSIRSKVIMFNHLSTAKETRAAGNLAPLDAVPAKVITLKTSDFMILTKVKQHSSEQVFE